MTSDPVIISVAITGSVPRKADNPALPVSPAEQIESTHEAFEAGAALVHVHVRNPDETPASDPSLFKAVLDGVRTHCPGMIVQFSTGGRGRTPAERAAALEFRPDMASLSTGSVNFPRIVYENQPPLVDELAGKMQRFGVKPEIEIFDLSHIHGAKRLVDEGLMDRHAHLQYVLGVKNAMPAERRLLEILVEEGRRIFPEGTWTAAGIGRHQNEVCGWAIDLGGHVRTGLEDNIRIAKDRLAASNAELVAVAAEAVTSRGR
ncbi:MAG: 3-keto-5-aminohexanoate cleavage protein, partial [Parafilimonas terrae]|nr:3-keto-5-aminohexanoate cleavage protein [Parafilimonas terrae]